MMNKNYFLLFILICQSFVLSAQSGKQKKADKLYDNFAYTKAIDIYRELLAEGYNKDHNQRKLADSYLHLRHPEKAVVLYAEVVQQPEITNMPRFCVGCESMKPPGNGYKNISRKEKMKTS